MSNQTSQESKKVVIHVCGGVPHIVSVPEGVEVEIVDYDEENEKEGGRCR